MSITLTPLPELPRISFYAASADDQVREYATAYALAAVEAYRASRVPMTEAQVASFLDAWATSSRSMKLIGLIRAIESHYSIGAPP